MRTQSSGVRAIACLMLTAAALNGCAGRILGASVQSKCPERVLTTEQSQGLYDQVGALINRDHEHHPTDALRRALPLLKRAALHGHAGARHDLTSHLIQAGIIEMHNGPFPWRTSLSVAQEGIMWMILSAHLDPKSIGAYDRKTFEVLLDPSVPLPQGFMKQSSGTAWMFQMISESSLERARQQAFAWRRCWGDS